MVKFPTYGKKHMSSTSQFKTNHFVNNWETPFCFSNIDNTFNDNNMKYFAFALLIGLLMFASCINKDISEIPVNGVYPHLLKAEKEFVHKLDKLEQKYEGKSEKEKVSIKEMIFDLIAKDTTTLSHEFGPLLENEEFDIVTSPDKRLRIYVTDCDTEMGASMNLVQYRDDAGIIHVIKKQSGKTSDTVPNLLLEHWIHKIFEFPCIDGTKLYVITSDENLNGEISSHSITYILAAYKINKDRLVPEEAFVTKYNATQKIERVFNYSYLWYYPEEQHHDFAEVDSNNNLLYVGNELDNEPIDRYQCFRFDGTNLTDTRESAPFWLHPSLHKYERIVYLCTSKTHYIRIDDMGKGIYRYASWPRNSKFADAPSLIIFGSETRIAERDDSFKRALSFVNDGYEYRILLIPGRWGFYAEEMVIIKNGIVIQRTELE